MPDSTGSPPNVKKLCSALGFRGRQRQKILIDAIDQWRVWYINNKCTNEEELRCWDPPKGNGALKEMAQFFLEHGHGSRFWPIKDAAELKYPDNTEELINSLHKLFYRRNLNAFMKSLKGETHASNDTLEGDAPDSADEEHGPRSDLSDASMDDTYTHAFMQNCLQDPRGRLNIRDEQPSSERAARNAGRTHIASVINDEAAPHPHRSRVEYNDDAPAGSHSRNLNDRSRSPGVQAHNIDVLSRPLKPFSAQTQEHQSSTRPGRPTPPRSHYRDSNGEPSTTHDDRPIHKRNVPAASTMDESEPKRARFQEQVSDSTKGSYTATPRSSTQPSSADTHAQSAQRPRSPSRSCTSCAGAHSGCDKGGRDAPKGTPCSRCEQNQQTCIYPDAVDTKRNSSRKTKPHSHKQPSKDTRDSRSASLYRGREAGPENGHRANPKAASSSMETRADHTAGKEATSKPAPSIEGSVERIRDSYTPGQLPSDMGTASSRGPRMATPSSSSHTNPIFETWNSEATVKHFIVITTKSQPVRKRWPGSVLTGCSLPQLFQEVSKHNPRKTSLGIKCTLTSSREEDFEGVEYDTAKDDERMFRDMIEEFESTIAEGLRRGITGFRISLEPMFGA